MGSLHRRSALGRTASGCLVAVALVAGIDAAAAAAAETPTVAPARYWEVWTDGTGGTHQTACTIHDFQPFSLGAKVESVSVDRLPMAPTKVWIAYHPKGWVGTWHENPKPQWVIPISGRWFVETTDGHRVEMGPGEASFGGDQAAKPDAAGHSGHLSGALDDRPVTLMFIQGGTDARPVNGCRFH